MKRSSLNSLAVALCMAFFVVSAFSQGQVIYNSIPEPLAGSYFSQPFQAQQASQVGDRLLFAGSWRRVFRVTQTMVSWACESGHHTTGCTTTPGATFSHPITLNIYNVNPDNSVGSLITSVEQSFDIPYRPSTSASCGDSRWFSAADNACYNGYAANITFNLPGVLLPNQVIYGIAYDTSGYGANPIGYSTACSTSPEGCPYDSLNVALNDDAPTVGVNPAPSDAYFDTDTAAWYCDGGAGGVGVFRLDAGCWTGFKSVVKFSAINPPANQNDCKNNGWKTRSRADGTLFKNQGDCVSFTNNGK